MSKILIADSDVESLQRIGDRLVFSGHTISRAASVWDAIQHVEDDEPDLVVVDVKLGRSEAFDLVRWLTTECGLPVIITTDEPQVASSQ